MTALRRECRTVDGRPKRRYATRHDAKNAIRNGGERLEGARPYRCAECDWFHLGHYPTSEGIRRQLRARHHPTP